MNFDIKMVAVVFIIACYIATILIMIVILEATKKTRDAIKLREAILYQIGCFFTHCVKGGGSFPCVKIYVVDFYNSGGLFTT